MDTAMGSGYALPGMTRLNLTAHYIKNSLNLAKIEQKNKDLQLFRRERNLLMYRVSDMRYVCVFSFGAVVLFGIENRKDAGRYLRRFGKALVGDGVDAVVEDAPDVSPETYDVVIDPEAQESVEFDLIRLKGPDPEKLLLVFHVAAQSVALDFLETRLDKAVNRFERIHAELASRGKLNVKEREVMKIIGMSGSIVNFIIDKLALLDKPDITWEDKEAESMHANLRKSFELDDRFSALRFKLEFIQDSSEVMLDVLENKKSTYLEIIIILLIALEFLFFIAAELH